LRQAAAVQAGAIAGALGLIGQPFEGRYAGTRKTGLAYNLAGMLEYQLSPQTFVGATLGLSNAQDYRQITGAIYLRYLFNGPRQLAAPSAGLLPRPLSSPYTPLL